MSDGDYGNHRSRFSRNSEELTRRAAERQPHRDEFGKNLPPTKTPVRDPEEITIYNPYVQPHTPNIVPPCPEFSAVPSSKPR